MRHCNCTFRQLHKHYCSPNDIAGAVNEVLTKEGIVEITDTPLLKIVRHEKEERSGNGDNLIHHSQEKSKSQSCLQKSNIGPKLIVK